MPNNDKGAPPPADQPTSEELLEASITVMLDKMDKKIIESEKRIGAQLDARLNPIVDHVNKLTTVINGAAAQEQEPAQPQQPQARPAQPAGRQSMNLTEILGEIREVIAVAKEAGVIKGEEPPRSNLDTLTLIAKKKMDARLGKIAEREAKHIMNWLDDDDPFKDELTQAIVDRSTEHQDV